MWIELPTAWIVVINCLGIPAVHLLVSWWVTCLPETVFRCSGPWYRVRQWEMFWYEHCLRIRRWKKCLPDAAPWFRGFSKGSLQCSDLSYLQRFAAETRRGECAHWIQWLLISGFVAWNPFPANLVILGYAVGSNGPCIVSLRHTRHRLEKCAAARFRHGGGRG